MKKHIMLIALLLVVGCGSKTEKMKDLSLYTKSEIDTYAKDNNIIVSYEEVYSTLDKGTVVSQSIKEGEEIKDDAKLVIELSLGRLSDSEYEKNDVFELGRVPVMMYHGIHNKKSSETNYTGGNVDKDGYQRTAEAFAEDLEFYYNSGYRMIRLVDYINGIIDVPLGLSPIVITFDDGLENNIKVTGLDEKGEIIIDPNSAVGVLEAFKKKHPDANVTATFFINGGIFQQEEYNEKILNWLVDNGYDVGNHTWSHVNFKNASISETQEEVGAIYELLDKYIPGKYVNIVALPYGSPGVKTHQTYPYILSGTYKGKAYHTDAALRVGWEADYSPFSTYFDKEFIKRIRAYDNNGVDFDIEANFKTLEVNRYVSDGNKNNIVIPKEYENKLGNTYNLNVITY